MTIRACTHPTRVHLCICGLLLLFSWLMSAPAISQQASDTSSSLQNNALRVYIDCSHCDLDYIRSEILFVNYVRDRSEAQMHTLITTEQAGNGGVTYTFTFIGQQEFLGVNDTLTFTSTKSDPEETVRAGVVRNLKLGLVRYVERTLAGAQSLHRI